MSGYLRSLMHTSACEKQKLRSLYQMGNLAESWSPWVENGCLLLLSVLQWELLVPIFNSESPTDLASILSSPSWILHPGPNQWECCYPNISLIIRSLPGTLHFTFSTLLWRTKSFHRMGPTERDTIFTLSLYLYFICWGSINHKNICY